MKELDQNLLLTINRDWQNPLFDLFFPFWTDFQKTLVFYVLLGVLLLILALKKQGKVLLILITCALGAFMTDKVNSLFVKPFFERPRPVGVILRTAPQGSFSFPSSHAVDVFFIVMFLGLYYPRLRRWLFPAATLTALSRVYCGVHYPGDILAGALFGMASAVVFAKLLNYMKNRIKFLAYFLSLIFCLPAFAFEDPTGGKPFLPWAWEDQLRPTIKRSYDRGGLTLLAAGTVSTFTVHQYDGKIFDYSEDGGNLLMDHSSAKNFGQLGNGMAGVAIALSQVYLDQENGVKTTQALLLTTVSHTSLSAIVQRERPRNRTDFLPWPSSFPSGHTSSAFALAGSMAYSYGWAGGIPAYAAATAIALSRVKENRHWASDIVAGAFIGSYWARAAFNEDQTKEAYLVLPVPIYDGMMLSAVREF